MKRYLHIGSHRTGYMGMYLESDKLESQRDDLQDRTSYRRLNSTAQKLRPHYSH